MRLMLFALALTAFALGARAEDAMNRKDDTFTTSDGIKIHYITAGERGSAVVLIHGFSGTAEGNWFGNGIAAALAPNHRVIAIDCRGHGLSDKPHDPSKYGPRMAEDVIELMDHLKIKRAHVHGYSMGGFIVTQLLSSHADRFLSAVYGGSGVPESDPQRRSEVPKDSDQKDPKEEEANELLRTKVEHDQEALNAVRAYSWKPEDRGKIDLTQLKIPVLAINGEFDSPNAKTYRMQREIPNFKSVILPGKSHLTAIIAGYIPQLYIDSLVTFLNNADSERRAKRQAAGGRSNNSESPTRRESPKGKLPFA